MFSNKSVGVSSCLGRSCSSQVMIDRGRIEEPTSCLMCANTMSMELVHNRCLFTDKQMIRLQVCHGLTPKSPLHVRLLDHLHVFEYDTPARRTHVISLRFSMLELNLSAWPHGYRFCGRKHRMRYPREKRLPRRLFLRSTISWMLFGRETGDIYTAYRFRFCHQSPFECSCTPSYSYPGGFRAVSVI